MSLDLAQFNVDFEEWGNELMNGAEVYDMVTKRKTPLALSDQDYDLITVEELKQTFKFIAFAIALACKKYGLNVDTVRRKVGKLWLTISANDFFGSEYPGSASIAGDFISENSENLSTFGLSYEYRYLIDATHNYFHEHGFQPSIGAIIFNTFHEIQHLYRMEQANNDFNKTSAEANKLLNSVQDPDLKLIIFDFIYYPDLGEVDANNAARELAFEITENTDAPILDEFTTTSLRNARLLSLRLKDESKKRIDTILGLTGPNAIDAITKKKLKFLVMLWRRKLIKNVEISEYQISQLEILAR